MKPQENIIYKRKIEDFSFDILNKKEFIELITDGRIGSRFMEKIMPKYFPSLVPAINGNMPFDFKNNEEMGAQKYDEKTLTKNGLKLCPSKCVGTRRTFKEEEFKKRTKELSYYNIVDIRNFPEIEFVFIRADSINTSVRQYSVEEARKLFFNNNKYIKI